MPQARGRQHGPGRAPGAGPAEVDPVLRLAEGAEAVVTASGAVLLRNGGRSVQARGLEPELLRAVVDAVDGSRTRSQVLDQLSLRWPRDRAEAVLRGLRGTVLAEDDPSPALRQAVVGVLGDGPLGHGLVDVLRAAGYPHCRLLPASEFASCADPDFRARQRASMPLAHHDDMGSGEGPVVTAEDLDRLIADLDLAVCALERVPYRAHLDVADAALRTGTTVLFVSGAREGGAVGPVYVPGANACVECERLGALFAGATALDEPRELLPYLTSMGVDAGSDQADRICATAVRVVEAVTTAPTADGTFCEVVRLPRNAGDLRAVVLPRPDCSRCGVTPARSAGPRSASPVRSAALADVALAQDRAGAAARASTRPRPGPGYRTVGILGGGTAGYLTALTFRRRFPEIDVTLIESSRLGVIGVGEATTPRLTEYLHSPADLGLDIVDFHERVRPVWKLGVRYEWGRPGKAFPWPFQYGDLQAAYVHDGDLSSHCLGAMLMDTQRVPVLDAGDGVSATSLLGRIPFAYHLDNPRFVRYLQEEAAAAGVTRRDAVVTDATVSPDGERVESLVTEDGEVLRFDLYVDSSGFRSVLLEGKLGSPFVSYADSLFTDSAVVANVPHDGVTKPYTVAETMPSGWCWNIAFEQEDHRGYVFSAAFCSPDQAEAQMRAANPGMSDAWSLRFRSGRHEHFWKGNVVAVGNAYAFVEPLASTAIHMLLFELDLLGNALPEVTEVGHQAMLNRQANAMWDSLRGWLAVQYRFNERLDTPFWRACRSEVELAGSAEYVQRFTERGLLSSGPARPRQPGPVLSRYANDYFTQDYVYDVMLLGQDVPAPVGRPRVGEQEWRSRTSRAREVAGRALPFDRARDWARRHPEELAALVTSPTSWLGEQLY
jgi:tryptophan 7-halogenase